MKFSFKTELSKLWSRNTARRAIDQNALAGIYPFLVIDDTKVQISNGILTNVIAPKTQYAENAQINFGWSNYPGREVALSDDQALLVLYSPELKLCGYDPAPGARSVGAAMIDAMDHAGHTVHTLIAIGRLIVRKR